MILENNENNYKLEIVKLKIRNQELEKGLSDKNMKVKEMGLALAALQGREAEINLLREDIDNKQQAIHIMDDTIVSLSKENQELRGSSK